MKTVIIVDHPNYDQSVVNRRWLDEVRKYPDEFIVHNLQSSYPRSSIDVAAEHSLIDNNGSVVFQFPLYWFNCPPMLKSWFDLVLTPGWAYAGGRHLEGRKVALAVTCGGDEAGYSAQGDNKHTLREFLNSLEQSLVRCHADFQGVYAFYGANPVNKQPIDATTLATSARNYVDFLNAMKQN